MATLYIVRGLPGSGKSTFATKLARDKGIRHYEADQYFESDGVYKFDPRKLGAAHQWCWSVTNAELSKDNSVVVSNTFTQEWELVNYIDTALDAGAKVEVIQCTGEWENIHGVPADKLAIMKSRFVDNSVIEQGYTPELVKGLIRFRKV